MAPVWLITGASKGFGYLLANKALDAGHKVIGTIRNKGANAEAVATIEGKGGKVIDLEMGDPQATIVSKINDAEKIFGTIDILVNNAGYSMLSPLEEIVEKDLHSLMAINVYGPIHAMQAVIPGMRARKSGLIINVSSIMGLVGMSGGSLYAATKFAVEGISESLVKELAPFGIDVLCVEPGAFATAILDRAQASFSSTYQGTEAGAMVTMLGSGIDKSKILGDPQKAVDKIFDYATGQGAAGALKGKSHRLMLGPDCLQGVEKKIETLKEELELSQPIGMTTGFSA